MKGKGIMETFFLLGKQGDKDDLNQRKISIEEKQDLSEKQSGEKPEERQEVENGQSSHQGVSPSTGHVQETVESDLTMKKTRQTTRMCVIL